DAAKTLVRKLLVDDFNWPDKSIIDLGDITAARATEQLLPIWMRLWKIAGHANFNFHINGI
ncbi:MAG TPA: NADP oxidoreductase, partial [Blastocatellia bacterium]|nr:NADP oxidoreductase [Blastocatellia bacterium]